LRRELEATEDLVIRLGKILSETALALKGPPPPLTRHSTHDLAEVARATVSQLDAMRKTAQEWWDLSELRREDDLRLRASVRAEHAALRAQLDEALADRERLLRLVEGSNANASQSTEERAREEAQGIRLRDEVRSLRARLDASERDAARYLSDYESEVAETERLTSLLSEAEQAHAALLDSADEAMRAGLEECERLRAEVGTLDDTVRTLEDDREETRRRVRVALGAIGVPGVADCADQLAALDATVTEVVAEAVATLNNRGLPGVTALEADLFKDGVLSGLIKKVKPTALVLDPPRDGLKTIAQLQAKKSSIKTILYISCDLATFTRDAQAIIKEGFNLILVQPVDMFPQTPHVELLARFARK
jgi:small-conductance mechanosensitive channel